MQIFHSYLQNHYIVATQEFSSTLEKKKESSQKHNMDFINLKCKHYVKKSVLMKAAQV